MLASAGHVLSSLLFHSPVVRFFGRQQARYLQKMASLFETNDLDQALRYAIPLATFEEMARSMPLFSPPKPAPICLLPWILQIEPSG
jgi:hypothetical protein